MLTDPTESPSFVKKEPNFEDTTLFGQEPELPKRTKVFKWKRTLLRIPLLAIWLVLLWLGGKVVWRESRHAESTSAMLVGNLIDIRAPFDSELTKVYVREGDVVKENQAVAYLDTTYLERELRLLLELKNIKESEPKSIESEIIEEQRRSVQFTEVSKKREAMLRTQVERMRIEIDFAKEKEERLQEGFEANTVPYIDVAEAVSIRRALEKDILLREQELQLQELITANAKEGRLLTESFQMVGKIQSLRSKITALESEINSMDSEMRSLKKQIDRFSIRSPRSGRVFSVKAQRGTVVRAGETLVTVEAEDEIFAIGWFKFDEAQKIGYETEAEVIIPALKKTYTGMVTSIGEAALSGLSGLQNSNRVDSDNVVFKIRLDGQATELRTGLRARIRIKHDDPL